MAVTGEIDAFTSSPLRRRLAEAVDCGAERLTIDLHGVTFIGAAGYATIDRARARLADRDGVIQIVGTSKGARVIGAPLGIDLGPLEALPKLSDEEAFDMLRRASQRMNIKLRGVAPGVVDRVTDQPSSD